MSEVAANAARYRLRQAIGSGGMARVHLARLSGPMGFGRTVAVKRLHDHLLEHPAFVAMFVDEARMASRVRHPNVVSILDVVADGKQLLLVMDYVHAEPLSALLSAAHKRGEPTPLPVAVAVVSGMLHGLHAAHVARDGNGDPLELVHRDISPQNVLVDSDGQVRISDFGIAKARGRLSSTQPGEVKGKLGYMAPEQIEGLAVDRRIDVYAAGVVLWETLTAQRLFTGDSEGEIVRKIILSVVEPPSRHVPVPPAVEAVVMRALSADPAARFGTALEMAEALEAAARLASQREVARWVEGLVGERLAARAALVAAAERDDEASPFDEPSPARAVVQELDPTTRLRTGPRGATSRVGWAVGAAVLLLAAVALASTAGGESTPRLHAETGMRAAAALAASAAGRANAAAAAAQGASATAAAGSATAAASAPPRPATKFDKKKLYGRD
ncbi:MAG: serine/threonine-protein kinase [Polyangiaceae bacterium]